jgi:hypothetical protein
VELIDRLVDERYGLHAQIIATKRDIAELETRMVQGLADCNGRIAECNTRIAEAKADLVKWLLGALTAQTALIAGIIKLF